MSDVAPGAYPQHAERPMTARDRADEHRGRLARVPSRLRNVVALEYRIHRKRADAEHVVAAHEQRRSEHRLARRPQPLGPRADRVARPPGSPPTERPADGGPDAV